MQKYHINLREEEREQVKKHLRSKKHSMESKKHAQILLDLDESLGTKLPSMQSVVARRGVSKVTIWKIRKKYCEEGLASVLSRKTRQTPPVPAKVTGEVEAHIIAICCSAPPEGKAAWTMQMIADKIVVDGIVDSISDETVRLVLKKRRSNRI